jgi:hypothetical protein
MITLEEVCKVLSEKLEVVDVEEEDRLLPVDFRSKAHDSIGWSYRFDQGRGNVAVQLDAKIGNSYQCITWLTWCVRAGTWVPETMSTEIFRKGKLEDELQLKFQWLIVNKEVDRALFTAKSLRLPDDAEVIRRINGDVSTDVNLGHLSQCERLE